jgi:hypothetical protein
VADDLGGQKRKPRAWTFIAERASLNGDERDTQRRRKSVGTTRACGVFYVRREGQCVAMRRSYQTNRCGGAPF